MIVVFGSVNVDLVARVSRIPRPGETVLAPTHERHHGGKGANQAIAAARAADGAIPVVMAGAVGDDPLGEAARANLAANGVDPSPLETHDAPTGVAFIAVDDEGENAITVASGANALARPDGLGPLLADAEVLVLQMEVPLAAVAAAARMGAEAGVRVVLNLAPVPIDPHMPTLDALLAATDVLVLNGHEADALCALVGLPDRDGPSRDAALAARCAADVVVTLGAAGARAATRGGESLLVPALPVDPVDTTGAGDAFVGALAAGLAEDLPLADALARAAVAGALACLAFGAQAASPTRAAIEAALRTRTGEPS
ncbi:PfkB family carbohydrate kinase [Salinarimonas rosea]|uniref:PfkB family carbohydrate kinase n=1 Tax=Salinarimonas rosea TaxID=552063 RepID=UPI0004080BA5|nr:PfkB family carbohydrate kinase [Salinarimonas rosea]